MTDQETREHLSPVAARMILAVLPDEIRAAFERRAAEIEYPVEAVLEIALQALLRLADAVDAEIRLMFTRKEVKRS